MSFYKNKNVLVTGGTGMIGRPLCEMLISLGANVTVASLDDESSALKGTKFLKLDLRIAKIIEANYVDKSDKLLKFIVEIENSEKKQVFAGIKSHE